jgi:hypothetical protein
LGSGAGGAILQMQRRLLILLLLRPMLLLLQAERLLEQLLSTLSIALQRVETGTFAASDGAKRRPSDSASASI